MGEYITLQMVTEESSVHSNTQYERDMLQKWVHR